MNIKIDKDFKNLIPPLKPEEFKQLEENILSEKRCREAILTWKGYIIDGHNRYYICQKHKIRFEILKLSFGSKEDVLIWIAEHQLGRRNLSDAVRIDIAHRRAVMLQQKAKENSEKPINIRKSVAAAAELSEQTVHRYMKVLDCAEPKEIEKLRKGEIKINTAYKKIKMVNKTEKIIDVGGGHAGVDVEGAGVYAVLANQTEVLCRACRVFGMAREYGGLVEVRGWYEKWLGVVEGFVMV